MTRPRVRAPRGGGQKSGPLPFPEIFSGERGKNWTVKSAEDAYTSMVAYSHKEMAVPDDEGECEHCKLQYKNRRIVTEEGKSRYDYFDVVLPISHADSVRMHEMSHARISPLGTPKTTITVGGKKISVDPKYIHLAEEKRVDLFALSLLGYDQRTEAGTPYAPYCMERMRELLAFHIARKEFREAVEIEFSLNGSQQIATGTTSIDVVTVQHMLSIAKMPINAETNAHMREFIDYLAEGEGAEALKMLRDARRDATPKAMPMTPAEEKELFKFAVFLHEFHNNYHLYTGFPENMHRAWGSANRLAKMTWPRVLRDAYELQLRFRNFADHSASAMKQGESEYEAAKAADKTKREEASAAARAATMDPSRMRAAIASDNSFVKMDKISTEMLNQEYFVRDGVRKLMGAESDGKIYKIKWPKMVILRPKLVDAFPPSKLQRSRSRTSEEGAIPRNMSRMTSDQRVFSRKTKVYGASVLIDDSGSMGMTERQLSDVLNAAPASVVGIYSGPGGPQGYLKIVAANGKRIKKGEELGTPGGGNEVDLPALEWLAQFPQPRIWYSDGQAIVGGQDYGTAMAECQAFCDAAGIIRVSSIQALHDVLSGRIKPKEPKVARFRRTPKNFKMKV